MTESTEYHGLSIVFWSLFLNKNRILLFLSIDAHEIARIKFSSYLQHLEIIKQFTKEFIATEVFGVKCTHAHTIFISM